MTRAAIAYSYILFSTAEQAKGDSTRRQTEAAEDWCRRHGVRLDTSTTFRDLGKSAYLGAHRKNPDRHALAAFLKLVECGNVPRGSYLIIENLDRLSREHIRPALTLLLNLIDAGIRVVQLKPVEQVFDEDVEPAALMMAIMELSRGHSESRMKSARNGAAWAEKRRRARECGEVLTDQVPAWLEVRGGKLHLIPERAAAVRRIFELAAAGYGAVATGRKLVAEKVPPMGTSGRWTRCYVWRILSDRRAAGVFQPEQRDGTPDGEPILGYYPAVVSEAEFDAARAGAAERRTAPGRVSPCVNVFAGLVKNARDGDAFILNNKPAPHRAACLVNAASRDGRARSESFPFKSFERAVFSRLAEIDPRELLGEDKATETVHRLSAERERVRAKIAELAAELENGDVAALAKVLRQLEARDRDLAAQLAEERQRAARPTAETWAEAQSLLSVLDSAPDREEVRRRLRSALRRLVDSIRLLVVPRGRDRCAVVQIWFKDDAGRRDYLIGHRAARVRRRARERARWWARSFTPAQLGQCPDLRNPDNAAKLEVWLIGEGAASLVE